MHHPPTEQEQAHAAVTRAIRDGRLRPTPCVVCWATPTHAHHPRGYDSLHRLDVVWLCSRCHERIHGRSIAQPGPNDYREQRRRTGVTIRELEARTGINRGRLSVIERGVMPTPDEAAKIIAALTLPTNDAAAS